ncbi:hypothetical protein RclHR1_01000018 [Rhizophagus clarus]|uniref:Uncharacterized protein n=1 Tax=Rhizophagus clarus TaxID=94130 RepID=A0A2Z6Q532_9GLOM|nr:hypothetical protein RclHR1_01000018 [Rhizophagus clarus]
METYPKVNTYYCRNLNTFFIGKSILLHERCNCLGCFCKILKENNEKNSELLRSSLDTGCRNRVRFHLGRYLTTISYF